MQSRTVFDFVTGSMHVRKCVCINALMHLNSMHLLTIYATIHPCTQASIHLCMYASITHGPVQLCIQDVGNRVI